MRKTAIAKHSRYSLKEPKRDVQELYVKNMKQKVAHKASLRKKLVQGFKNSQPALSDKLKRNRLSMAVVFDWCPSSPEHSPKKTKSKRW